MSEDTEPCGRCEVEIPADSDRCPVCDYRPAGRSPLAMRVGEYAFLTACLVSLAIFVAGVAGVGPAVLGQLAIVTPYTTGITAFFAVYIHRKRRTTATDDDVFG